MRALLLGVLLLAACGDGDEPSDDASGAGSGGDEAPNTGAGSSSDRAGSSSNMETPDDTLDGSTTDPMRDAQAEVDATTPADGGRDPVSLDGGTAGSGPVSSDEPPISHFAVGENYYVAIAEGLLYTWGHNYEPGSVNGLLGIGIDTELWVTEPAAISTDDDWTSVAASRYHACAVRSGALFCWGTNIYGEVGTSPAAGEMQTIPMQVGTATNWDVIEVSSEFHGQNQHPFGHSCGIRDGALYCWGSNMWGELGVGIAADQDPHPEPTQVGTDTDWEVIALGRLHSCGIRSGELYCWGSNDSAQLGFTADNTPYTSPQRLGGYNDWTAIACGDQFSCGIRQGGLVFCWGSGDAGALGNGIDDELTYPPQQAGNDGPWLRITAGSRSACMLDGAGQAHCWGDRWPGGPTPVEGGHLFTHIAIGEINRCALTTDSELYCLDLLTGSPPYPYERVLFR